MAKRPLKELFNLNKVEEVSVCTKNNPPANGFKQFEIMKNSFNKSEFEDLFEELSLPEYGDFVGYLNLFLEDDVNQVAYYAFIDALFVSLKEVCFDEELTKEDKALKMKDNFDKFVEEYKSSVITKTEDGKVFLNMNKNNNKDEIVDIKKCYGECYPCYGEDKTFSEIVNECAPERINRTLWDLFIYKLNDKIYEIHYMDSEKYTKEQKGKMIVDLFAEFVKNFNETELIKSQKNIEKQETKMDFKSFVEGLKSLITKAEESPEVVEEVKPETEIIPAEEVSEEAKVEEVVEPEQEPKLAETPAEEEIAEESKVEENEEEIPATEEAPVVEEPKIEGDEEPKEEPVQKSEEPSIEEILKAKEDELKALKTQIEKAEEAQKESAVKLEKAELLKSIESEYSGLVGTPEEILEKVYEINKSELSLETKEFALEGLKKLSAKNLEKTLELGVEVKDEVLNSEEEIQKSKIQKAISEHGLTEGQALLYVRGERTLKQAKEISLKKK